MPPMRWVGFGFIWLALAMFTFSSLRNHHHQQHPQPAATVGA
jgi:EamA domain-containing membrane protein RarD